VSLAPDPRLLSGNPPGCGVARLPPGDMYLQDNRFPQELFQSILELCSLTRRFLRVRNKRVPNTVEVKTITASSHLTPGE